MDIDDKAVIAVTKQNKYYFVVVVGVNRQLLWLAVLNLTTVYLG